MTSKTLADLLNRSCHCINVNQDALQESLESRLAESGAWSRLRDSHPHLLADSPVFVAHEHIEQMQAVIAAIGRVTERQSYQQHVLQWAPEIAASDYGPRGVFLGYDFHLTNDGPKLIEVNTNAGGALLLLHVASAQQACCPEVENFVVGHVDIADLEYEFVNMFRRELDVQSPGKSLRRVAIVDEDPQAQYLRPEFMLFRQMFVQSGIDAIIAGPDEFDSEHASLQVNGQQVDLVYNRLTDFYLQSEACAVLKDAYENGAAVFTPGPRAHALFANKRNLVALSDDGLLQALGVDHESVAVLSASVPRTEIVTSDNCEELWARRKQLYFKPNRGYGSRGTYKGAKLTKKTWGSILEADYIAQELVPPSERLLVVDGNERSMKLDVRCYVYDGEIQLLGARLYRGQTTNFRTDGGGLAAVFTMPHRTA